MRSNSGSFLFLVVFKLGQDRQILNRLLWIERKKNGAIKESDIEGWKNNR
jgi:hypothetical protein